LINQIYEMYCYRSVSIQLKILLFSFRKTRISKFIFGASSSKHSAEGEDAFNICFWCWCRQLVQRQWCKTVALHSLTIHPKLLAIGFSIWLELHHVNTCSWGDGPCVLPTWVLVILAVRNVKFCSTGALTEEVLAVVESVAGWVSFTACKATLIKFDSS